MTNIDIDNGNSRLNPSDDFGKLIKMYKEKHAQGEGMFNGRSLLKFVDLIKAYLEVNNCKSLMDYGCGKGILYGEDYKTITNEIDCPLPEYWNIEDGDIYLYDPAYEKYSRRPGQKRDAVVCTDVLEHIAKDDLSWVVDEIFGYARKMVFINVACFKAMKTLPDGRNAHISVFDPDDWLQLFAHKSRDYKHLTIYVFADTMTDQDTTTFETLGYRIDQYPRIIKMKNKAEEED